MIVHNQIESINAVTLAVSDMRRSTEFYDSLGFVMAYGGADSAFTSYRLGEQKLNLIREDGLTPGDWGRVIIYVSDVDAIYERVVSAGHHPEASPRDASWGERFFHLDDPDGHQLSFARPL